MSVPRTRAETPMIQLLLLFTTTALAGPVTSAPPEPEVPPPEVIEVQMIDKSATEFVFEPSRITVRPGDMIRFVQKGAMPHNVEFKDAPEGAGLGDARVGPYLTQKGETYEVVVDERFPVGEYPFICTPHQLLGMTGVLIVASDS